ncbi:hypothetical protein [Iningainema tapete]|uniref:Uncharacterized protein n=1 Tax=Iningainema tapete BLCC-T55 TaxID=2748662 RepID=A0A8J6XIS9_9CYAN|nr:hypothetical protein [Iningainema tapete]MBD2771501.1 hypothetical protein [Iningainema tapete BLCC-T55]
MTTTENNSLFTEVTVEESATVCGGQLFLSLPSIGISLFTPVGTRGEVLSVEANLIDLGYSLRDRGIDVDGIINELRLSS